MSMQAEAHFRDTVKMEFRDKIRREVEERQRKEREEKEAKRKAAEERRAAVVARIRKQQEEEEKRLREIAEAAERATREAELRLQRDREGMTEEDAMSRLAEQQRVEEEEREQWLAAQAERLRVWEEEQRRKDEAEAAARADRLAELEAKKRKLAELQSKTGGGPAISVTAAREEALKLSKQMKMQNKAKFVSKKRRANENPCSQRDAEQENFKEETVTSVPLDMRAKIDALSSEKDMHHMERDLMARKRELRMQLRVAEEENRSESVSEILKKIDEMSSVEAYLLQRIQSVQPIVNESCERRHSRADCNVKSSSDIRAHVSADNSLYAEVEKCIRDVNHAISCGDHDTVEFEENKQRRLGLLRLHLADLSNRFADTDDVVGYHEKLQVASIKLTAFLEKGKHASKPCCVPPPIQISDADSQSLRRSSSVKLPNIPPPPDENASNEASPQKSLHSLPTPKAKTPPDSPNIKADLPTVSPLSFAPSASAYNSDISSSLNYSESSKSIDAPFLILSSRSPVDKAVIQLPTVSERTHAVQDGNLPDLGEDVTYVADSDVIDDDDEVDDSNYVNYEEIEGWNECLYTTMATAAHHAAFYGYTAVLEVLSRYFDVFVMDKNGRTPLFYACLRNNLDCVLLLISIGRLVMLRYTCNVCRCAMGGCW